ncbi:MAG: hypothetical protein AAGD07_07130 [Planctomycetota bacterium]
MSAVTNSHDIAAINPLPVFPERVSVAESKRNANSQPVQAIASAAGTSRYQARRILRELKTCLIMSTVICMLSMTVCGVAGLLSVSSSVAFVCGSIVAYVISFAETSKAILASQGATTRR